MAIVYTYIYICSFQSSILKLLLVRKQRLGFVRPLRTHDIETLLDDIYIVIKVISF